MIEIKYSKYIRDMWRLYWKSENAWYAEVSHVDDVKVFNMPQYLSRLTLGGGGGRGGVACPSSYCTRIWDAGV